MREFALGQCWVSEREPELGLGRVSDFDRRTVEVTFSGVDEVRRYASESAPIRRLVFEVGETVCLADGRSVTVEATGEADGLRRYQVDGGEWVDEGRIEEVADVSDTESRLRAGMVEPQDRFALRYATLRYANAARRSAAMGFAGARIDLIPHQLYIAGEVAGRYHPRVLLADEVGLGKTIEAAMVVHRLILTGEATRVLILVPESLLHQWFVELLRRFNLWFTLCEEDRCAAHWEAGRNPFLEDQLLLAGMHLFKGRPEWAEAAAEAGWDLLVVDEAHHLEWSEQAVSDEYRWVESIAAQSEGLLLLTATPEQLGLAGHYARLRLLDAGRYPSFEEFQAEQKTYLKVAAVVERLVARKEPTARQKTLLRGIFGELGDDAFEAFFQTLLRFGTEAAERALLDLVDRHGTGRVIFRNTREGLSGFPVRVAKLVPLDARCELSAAELQHHYLRELETDQRLANGGEFDHNYHGGVRSKWLAGLLRSLDPFEKVLLICRSPRKVVALDAALRAEMNINIGLFHEEMSLVQRDRAAAWFADPDGARILICSEIGSEGRNFQFAHHLVLFDLPLDPELLEQRIGRLDRIGQTQTIRIHVPFLRHSCLELLARWHHEGLDGMEQSLRGGGAYQERFGSEVIELARVYHEQASETLAASERLIEETRDYRERLEAELKKGQSTLLALNSYRPLPAERLAKAIRAADRDPALREFLSGVFDLFGVQVEDINPNTFKLSPGPYLLEVLPGLPAEGLIATLDRTTALAREDIAFLTWDHPLVRGAMETILYTGKGNCAFVSMPAGNDGKPGMLLEAIFIVETRAPPKLHADRFLPATPIRTVVDLSGRVLGEQYSVERVNREATDEPSFRLQAEPQLVKDTLSGLLAHARASAEKAREGLVEKTLREAHAALDGEVERLEALAKVNENVRSGEIAAARSYLREICKHLARAELRLDSLRWILLQ